MSRVGNALKQLFFPHHCFLCNEVIYPHQRLCGECVKYAPYILPPVCERCGRNTEDCCCGKHRRTFERSVSPFYHKGVAKTGIYTLKSEGYRITVAGFAEEMADRLYACGIRGFWNFAPLDVKLPRDAATFNVHLDEGLQKRQMRAREEAIADTIEGMSRE